MIRNVDRLLMHSYYSCLNLIDTPGTMKEVRVVAVFGLT